MTQSFKDKCDAIEGLLGLIYYHQDDIQCASRTQPQRWESEPSPLDDPPTPPQPYYLGCNGRCYTCQAYQKSVGKKLVCPPEELWVRERDDLRRRYRIADIEASLMRMRLVDVEMAQSVWAQYVEPWPDVKTEPIAQAEKDYRKGVAWLGAEWLAEDIEGDVLAYGEKREPIDNEIARMLAYGNSARRIAKALRVSQDRVRRVKCEGAAACEVGQ